ncbi:MAG TPA: AraC family transcriptional regulator [Capsulimonadaceae bacterium]|jgi:AraC family cel operon transcriptional repressor
MNVSHLQLADFTKGAPYHVARVTSLSLRSAEMHDHDFYEVLYVHQGVVKHVMPHRTDWLTTGTVAFIRPTDTHAVFGKAGEATLITNVAFPAAPWHSYCALTGLNPETPSPFPADSPLARSAPVSSMKACVDSFTAVMESYISGPTSLSLCAFWCALFQSLDSRTGDEWPDISSSPEWLRSACREIAVPENLAAGVPRLVEIAGVSGAHLSRCMRDALNMTPTEFVNEQRLRRSAALLQSSPAEITEIAYDCGFENLSYFYRLFRARYGTTPRSYRLNNSRSIIP